MKKIYQSVYWFIKENKKGYALLIFLLTGIAVFALSPAYVLGYSIDVIITSGLTLERLLLITGMLIILPLIRYFISMAYNYLSQKMALKLTYQMRKRYLDQLFEMDATFYETFEKGDLISRITADLDSITQAASSLLEGLLFNIGMIILSITLMISAVGLELTLISFTLMPIGLTLLNIFRHKKRKYFKRHREIYAHMTETVLESVEGQKAIRAYVQEDNDFEKQKKAIHADIESWRYIVKFENWFNPMFEVVYGISYLLGFSFGVFYIFNGAITLGGLLILLTYIGMLYGPIISLSNIFAQMNQASIAIERIDQIMHYIPEVKDEKDAKSVLSFDTIKFNNVTFKYPFDKEPTLKHMNFDIKKGMTLGIVGPTGSGKSTLIRQLLREFNVTSGSITLDGIPLSSYQIEDVRKLVGYVPQQHIIFKKSVEDNILLGSPNASHDMFEKAIKMADFQKDLSFLQESVHTKVSESGTSLSGGQKQRLSIARALIKDPEILILDDSLSAVDAKTETTILEQLKLLREGKTNIIIAHRFSAVKHADMILVLQKGEIVSRGTHEELMKIEGFYKTQFIEQMMMEPTHENI